MSQTVAQLRVTRRYLTSFLLNFGDLNTDEMSVATLLATLDYLAEHPDEYLEIINEQTTN